MTLAGEKMSKSLGNTADVQAAVAQYGGRAVRLFLAGPHYRSAIELSDASLAEAAAQLGRIDSFLARAGEAVGHRPDADLPQAFAAAMDDDLGTPGALAVLFTTIKEGNTALGAGDTEGVRAAYGSVLAMLDILGLDPAAPPWADGASSSGDLTPVVDALVTTLLEQRAEARRARTGPPPTPSATRSRRPA